MCSLLLWPVWLLPVGLLSVLSGAFVVVFVVVVTGVVVAAGVVVGAFVVVALVVVVAIVVVIFIVVVVAVLAGVVVLGAVVVTLVCMQLMSLFLSVSMALYPFSCSTSSGAPTSLLLYLRGPLYAEVLKPCVGTPPKNL